MVTFYMAIDYAKINWDYHTCGAHKITCLWVLLLNISSLYMGTYGGLCVHIQCSHPWAMYHLFNTFNTKCPWGFCSCIYNATPIGGYITNIWWDWHTPWVLTLCRPMGNSPFTYIPWYELLMGNAECMDPDGPIGKRTCSNKVGLPHPWGAQNHMPMGIAIKYILNIYWCPWGLLCQCTM